MAKAEGFRTEKDSLGEKKVPRKAYYGIQTQRAIENFQISGLGVHPLLITATAGVKFASAKANHKLGLLDRKRADAICRAASEVISGGLRREFVVDAFQAGAGTSHNMNANEVIANRAIELLGGSRGDYSLVHPNDHVNMSQSTNDVVPTAIRIAAINSSRELTASIGRLEKAFTRKSKEFSGVIKSGRTHLQDAVPVTLGQEFGSYADAMRAARERLNEASQALQEVGLGATAVGTGINTHRRYRDTVLAELRKATGIKGLEKARDSFAALSFMSDFAALSGAMKLLCVDLVKISGDLRLLASGPNTGLAEIMLPALQPGSSIMPGKVNPVMAEMLSMVSFHVMGADQAIALAAQAGQLELNVMTPVISHNLLGPAAILTNALDAFTLKCVSGIKADRKRCALYFESSAGLATVLNVFIGYEKAASVVKEARTTGKSIKETALEKGVLTEAAWRKLMKPQNITSPFDLKGLLKKGRSKK
ncbi:MAG: aspartate ammonia-lyase [Deltaproteobacteria bacterium]|nr:aspartate ammonia-lyase [Deltaproteobacteria bacterium]